MGGYESDSSEEGSNFTETNVLLGYASVDPGEANDTTSKIGGTPDFFTSNPTPSFSLFKCTSCAGPTVQLLQLNAELPSHFPSHDRRIWVTICPSKACRRKAGCVRAIRGVRVDMAAIKEAEKKKKIKEDKQKKEAGEDQRRREEENKKNNRPSGGDKSGMGEFLFGATGGFGKGNVANPFAPKAPVAEATSPTRNKEEDGKTKEESKSDAMLGSIPAMPTVSTANSSNPTAIDSFASVLQRATLGDSDPASSPPSSLATPECWPSEAKLPQPFPTLYLSDADYETLDPEPAAPPQAVSIEDMDSGPTGGAGKEDKDTYESSMDSSFQRFADRVGQNPEQVIRYEFGGVPLIYSKTDAVGKMLSKPGTTGFATVSAATQAKALTTLPSVPRCGSCGGERVFEVQLTPHAIAELEGESLSLDGMDWGTIIVAVCKRDCLPSTFQPKGMSKSKEEKDKGAAYKQGGVVDVVGGGGGGGGDDEEEVVGYLNEWVGVQWEELGK